TASTVRAATLFALGQVTISADVAALTGAVLKGMFMSKVKIVVAMLMLASAMGLGVGAGSYQLIAGEEDRKKPAPSEKAPPKARRTEEKADGRLPIGLQPLQALVSLTENGRLAVKTVAVLHRPTTMLTPDGQRITTYRVDRLLALSHYDLAGVEVLDNTGK